MMASRVGKIILKATWSSNIGRWTRLSFLRLKSHVWLQSQERLIYPVNPANDDVMRSSRIGHSTSECLMLSKRKSIDLLSSRGFFPVFDWVARKVIVVFEAFSRLCASFLPPRTVCELESFLPSSSQDLSKRHRSFFRINSSVIHFELSILSFDLELPDSLVLIGRSFLYHARLVLHNPRKR